MRVSGLTLRLLTRAEKQFLKAKLSDRALSAYVLDRYRIIQAIIEGETPTVIARILDCERPTVYYWVRVFNESGFRDFEKLNNPYGRPALLTPECHYQLIKTAKTDPRTLGLPFSEWSVGKLNDYCRIKGIIPPLSQEWIRRLLLKEGIQFRRAGGLPFRSGRDD